MKINFFEPIIMFLVSLACIFIEMSSPANFLFVNMALAFFVSGLYLLVFPQSWALFVVWVVVFFASLIIFTKFMKKQGYSVTDKSSADGSILTIPGQQCKIIRLLPNGDIFVLLGKEEWIATPSKNESFSQGDLGLVIKVVGNRLIIKKI